MKLQLVYECSCGKCGKCPTVYKTSDGRFAVQGVKMEQSDRPEGIPEGEDIVLVPAELIDGLLAARTS